MNNHRELIAELHERLEVLRRLRDDVARVEGKVSVNPADRDALYALRQFVQLFYGCVEDMAYRAAIEINGEVPPHGAESHKKLLEQAYREVPGRRKAIFERTPPADLDELLRYRHWSVHNYAAEVDPEKMLANARRALRIFPDLEADAAALVAWLRRQGPCAPDSP